MKTSYLNRPTGYFSTLPTFLSYLPTTLDGRIVKKIKVIIVCDNESKTQYSFLLQFDDKV